jgi:hypothetical protein
MPERTFGEDDLLDEKVAFLAKKIYYPPVPDIAGVVRQRLTSSPRRPVHLNWSLAAVLALVFLAAALFASPARARIVEWLRVGAVRIFLADPTLTAPTAVAPPDFTELAGRTTLAEAQTKAGFSLKTLSQFREPDRVYYQELDRAQMVIMVWFDPDLGDLALYQIQGPVSIINKRYVGSIEETVVGEQWAVWVEGPYQLYIETGTEIDIRAVEGRTLLWQQDGVTYRLESTLTIEKAREVAESLQPIVP